MLLEMGFIVSVRFTNFVPNQSGIVINFDNWEQNKPSANRRQIFVHVTLLRGIGHEFNMADERETISERLRSGYIAFSSSEFNVCITGIWKENYLGIVILSKSYFQKL